MRDQVRERVREFDASTKLYWVRCADAVALERCRARNRSLGGALYIADATFEALKARFEPLGPDEAYELLDT
jgi:hypothetical protein